MHVWELVVVVNENGGGCNLGAASKSRGRRREQRDAHLVVHRSHDPEAVTRFSPQQVGDVFQRYVGTADLLDDFPYSPQVRHQRLRESLQAQQALPLPSGAMIVLRCTSES